MIHALLDYPGGGWVKRCVEVEDASAIVMDHEETYRMRIEAVGRMKRSMAVIPS